MCNTLCDPFSIMSDPTNKHEQQLNKEIALDQGKISFFWNSDIRIEKNVNVFKKIE